MNVIDADIKNILTTYKNITVIGLSRDPSKAAHRVPMYAKSRGYKIVGVHPTETEIAGISCYPNIAAVPPEFRKFVDVFRPPKDIPGIVDQILAAGGTEVLFLQLGITHVEAESKAEAAGLRVISDRCLYIELQKV